MQQSSVETAAPGADPRPSGSVSQRVPCVPQGPLYPEGPVSQRPPAPGGAVSQHQQESSCPHRWGHAAGTWG